jgi:hypothetical protein
MNPLITIGRTYEDRQLTLVCGQGPNTIDWEYYPITITQNQCATIQKFDAVITFLEEKMKIPSEAANIHLSKIASPVIRVINIKCKHAIVKYKNLLSSADEADLHILEELEKLYTITSFKGFWGFFYSIGQCFGIKYKSDIEYAKEGSVHRLAFMQQVSTLETERLNDIKDRISKCITPLLADVKNSHVEDIAVLKQLHQISAIYNALFPNEPHLEVEAALEVLTKISRDSAALLTM